MPPEQRLPETDAAIEKYSREVFFFLSQNKTLGRNLAEFIVPKLRNSDWIMECRDVVFYHGPDGTINYSDYMFSAQIEGYDDMVEMVVEQCRVEQCRVGCEEARAALRKIIMAIITDSANPYGQDAGRDNGRVGLSKDDGSHCSSDSRDEIAAATADERWDRKLVVVATRDMGATWFLTSARTSYYHISFRR